MLNRFTVEVIVEDRRRSKEHLRDTTNYVKRRLEGAVQNLNLDDQAAALIFRDENGVVTGTHIQGNPSSRMRKMIDEVTGS